MFSYYITTHFIPSNKNYNFCRNPHLVYQTYPYSSHQKKKTYPYSLLCQGICSLIVISQALST